MARVELKEKRKQEKIEKKNVREAARAERAKELEFLRHRRQNVWNDDTHSDDEDEDYISGSGSNPLPDALEESQWFRFRIEVHEAWNDAFTDRHSKEFKDLAQLVEESVTDEIKSFSVSTAGLSGVKLLNAE